tara:strand:- start:720 stop:872 length:153 start_codon:yes stop_codon:yes gene_type:complete
MGLEQMYLGIIVVLILAVIILSIGNSVRNSEIVYLRGKLEGYKSRNEKKD